MTELILREEAVVEQSIGSMDGEYIPAVRYRSTRQELLKAWNEIISDSALVLGISVEKLENDLRGDVMAERAWPFPLNADYKCPECGVTSPAERWSEGHEECETCGDHSAVICPACGETYASVHESSRLKKAQVKED